MRTRVQRRRRRRDEEEDERRPTAATATADGPADRVLALQRKAGNRAVGAALARWGVGWLPLAGAPAWPKRPEVRFGPDLVVPLEAVNELQGPPTRKGREEEEADPGGNMHLTFEQGDHSATLLHAAAQARRFDVVDVIITRGDGTGIRYTLTKVYVTGYQISGKHETVTLSFAKREFSMAPPPRR